MASEDGSKKHQILFETFEISHTKDKTTPQRKNKNKIKRLCLGLLIALLLISVSVYVVLPIAFYYSRPLQRLVVFQNWYEDPRVTDFGDLDLMLPGTRNFYIDVPFGDETDKLGVWHILSSTAMSELGQPKNPIEESLFNEKLSDNTELVIIYLHGGGNTRAAKHRMKMYDVLRTMGHVFAFDYRGFADSTDRPPSEEQLVQDALGVYNWLSNKNLTQFWSVIWGHSLGTAVATNLCTRINNTNIEHLVLEAPITNMAAAVRNHPLSKFFSWLPYYDDLILEPFRDSRSPFAFQSEVNIKKLSYPIIQKISIFHAKNDQIVPMEMGKRMHDLAKRHFKNHPNQPDQIEWLQFASGGHEEIYRQPNFNVFVFVPLLSLPGRKGKQFPAIKVPAVLGVEKTNLISNIGTNL